MLLSGGPALYFAGNWWHWIEKTGGTRHVEVMHSDLIYVKEFV